MRISDWSSDVCSSDLHVRFSTFIDEDGRIAWRFVYATGPISRKRDWREPRLDEETQIDFPPVVIAEMRRISEKLYERDPVARSEERRVGKECVSKCRSRGSP